MPEGFFVNNMVTFSSLVITWCNYFGRRLHHWWVFLTTCMRGSFISFFFARETVLPVGRQTFFVLMPLAWNAEAFCSRGYLSLPNDMCTHMSKTLPIFYATNASAKDGYDPKGHLLLFFLCRIEG